MQTGVSEHACVQVELLASRLARVELMVGRAEQVANAMQVRLAALNP